jgi:predicted nucleotidyltransferase
MRAVGLITEYNPFHNGHLHHLRASRKAAGADVAVAVMSGHFLQRGEPALLDKWLRAEMALRCGVDVVVELPFAFACASAPHFARGAVQCLEALGVETLCFGSESGDLAELQHCALLLDEHEAQICGKTAALLRQGMHHAAARSRVLAEVSGGDPSSLPLHQPNNILGIEYLRALQNTGSVIQPFTVTRIGAGYHDDAVASDKIASASGIRKKLAANKAVDDLLPSPSANVLRRSLAERSLPDDDLLHRLLLAQIFRGRDHLQTIYQVESGLDARLKDAAAVSGGWRELVDAVKVRQFTRTRIQRTLMYILNGACAGLMDDLLGAGPLYLRLLGSSPRGRAFLGAARNRRKLPLITNLSRVYAQLKRTYQAGSETFRLACALLDLDLRATRNYTLLLPTWSGRSRDRDFYEDPRHIEPEI